MAFYGRVGAHWKTSFSSVILVSKALDHITSKLEYCEEELGSRTHRAQGDSMREHSSEWTTQGDVCHTLLLYLILISICTAHTLPVFCKNQKNVRGVHSMCLIFNKQYFNLSPPPLESGYVSGLHCHRKILPSDYSVMCRIKGQQSIAY